MTSLPRLIAVAFVSAATAAGLWLAASSEIWCADSLLFAADYDEAGGRSAGESAMGTSAFKTVRIVHFGTNSFYHWRLIGPLAALPAAALIALYGVLFYCGSLAVVSLLRRGAPDETSGGAPLLGPAVAAGFLLLLFGCDTAVWATAAVSPWVAWAFLEFVERMRLPLLAAVVGAAISAAIIANQFAFYPVLIAVLLVLPRLQFLDQRGRLGLLLATAAAFFALFLAPVPEVPALPLGGHFVPRYEAIEPAGARFGPEPAAEIIDRSFERRAYLPIAAAALLANTLLLVNFRGLRSRKAVKSTPAVRDAAVVATATAAIILLDGFFLPPDFSQAMPLQALRRLMPGQLYVPVAAVLAAGAFVLSAWTIAAAAGRSRRRALFSCLLVASVFTAQWHWQQHPAQPRQARPWRELAKLTAQGAIDEPAADEIADLLLSPGYAAVKELGLWTVSDMPRVKGAIARAVQSGQSANLSAVSVNPQLAVNAGDGDPATRWSPTVGAQRGDEWVEVSLAEPVAIDGIVISAGNFYTDYPRGIRIESSAADCGAVSERQTVADYPNWHGSLNYTGSGWPYFEPEHSVRLVFPSKVVVKCLRVYQTAIHAEHDWSVDSIELILSTDGT